MVGGWLALDAVRQSQLGMADAGLWFTVAAGGAGAIAAVAVGRWPRGRRMAVLILWWLITAVGDDVGGAWPNSSIATTVFMLALALQGAAFAHMALAYPSGYVRDRLERAFLVIAYAIGVLFQLPPALFADPRVLRRLLPTCTVASVHRTHVRPDRARQGVLEPLHRARARVRRAAGASAATQPARCATDRRPARCGRRVRRRAVRRAPYRVVDRLKSGAADA